LFFKWLKFFNFIQFQKYLNYIIDLLIYFKKWKYNLDDFINVLNKDYYTTINTNFSKKEDYIINELLKLKDEKIKDLNQLYIILNKFRLLSTLLISKKIWNEEKLNSLYSKELENILNKNSLLFLNTKNVYIEKNIKAELIVFLIFKYLKKKFFQSFEDIESMDKLSYSKYFNCEYWDMKVSFDVIMNKIKDFSAYRFKKWVLKPVEKLMIDYLIYFYFLENKLFNLFDTDKIKKIIKAFFILKYWWNKHEKDKLLKLNKIEKNLLWLYEQFEEVDNLYINFLLYILFKNNEEEFNKFLNEKIIFSDNIKKIRDFINENEVYELDNFFWLNKFIFRDKIESLLDINDKWILNKFIEYSSLINFVNI